MKNNYPLLSNYICLHSKALAFISIHNTMNSIQWYYMDKKKKKSSNDT